MSLCGSERQSGDSSTRGPCLGKGERRLRSLGKGASALRPTRHPAVRLLARVAASGPSSLSRPRVPMARVGISEAWDPSAAGLRTLAWAWAKFASRVQPVPSLPQPCRCRLSSPSSCSRRTMESPVQIFRGEPGPTCAPSTCLLPNDSGWFPGWAEPDGNSSAGSEDAPLEPAHISPAIPVIITAVYSVVFVVGLVGNSLVMFVIIR